MGTLINLIFIILFLLIWVAIIKRFIWNRIAPVKTVKAELVDKYKTNRFSRYPKTFSPERYIIVFKINDKKLLFNVSEFSYNNYMVKKKGTLKYKGSNIISFK